MMFRLLLLATGLAVLSLSLGCLYPVYEPRGPRPPRMYESERHYGPRQHW
jgi:hypothetical protein